MSVEEDDDRDTMLADFGVAATVNGATPVTGIFDDAYFEDGIGQGPGAESSKPAFTCKTSDVASATQGQTLVVGATTYHIVNIRPDGQGWTLLILEKQ